MFGLSAIKLYIMLALVIGASAASAWVTHKVDNASYEALELKYATASQKAITDALTEQKRLDGIKVQASIDAVNKQRQITKQIQARLNDAQTTIRNNCIPWSTVQLLDATVLHRSPQNLKLPSGGANDACSGTNAPALVAAIIKNYGIAQQNEQQLNDLIGYINKVKN